MRKDGPTWQSRVRAIHRTLALCFGFVFVFQALTGSLLALAPTLDEWVNPELWVPSSDTTIPNLVDMATAIVQHHPDAQGVGVEQVYEDDSKRAIIGFWPEPDPYVPGEWLFWIARLHPITGEVVAKSLYGSFPPSPHEIVTYIHALHTNLTFAALGKYVLLGVATFFCVNIMTGTTLWWPGRKRALQALSPSSVKQHALAVTLHRLVGSWFGWLLLVLAITGFVLQFGFVINDEFLMVSSPAAGRPQLTPEQAWSVAQQHYPEAKPLQLGAPFTPEGIYRIELVPQSGALAGETVQMFLDNYSGELIEQRHWGSKTMIQRLIALLEPLHGGEILGAPGAALAFMCGLVPLMMFLTGLRTWRGRRKRTPDIISS